MNIDIESVKQIFSAIGMAISTLKQAKDLMPDGTRKTELTEAIDNAEKQLTSAETESARSIGYEICHNHYPAGIMLSADEINWKCPTCGNQKSYARPKNKNPWSSLGNKSRS